MIEIPLNEVVYFDVITSNPTSGAAVDADATPTFAVYEESTDTDIGVGGNLTKRTSLTGNYRGSFTASAANGFEVGKWYSVIASATVSSTAGKARAMGFRIIAAENTAGVQTVDVVSISATASNIKKNTALTAFPFVMTDSTDHNPATGKTITATRSLDGASFGACANSAAEVGNGVYIITLAAGDLNANTITLRFTATGCDDRLITLITQP